MKARVIRPQELGPDLLARWRSFTENDDIYASPFYAPEFTAVMAEVRGDAYVAVLEEAGETVGFFPFHKLRGGVAKPIGGPISDYHGPVLARNERIQPTELLSACGLASYDFNHLPAVFESLAETAIAHSHSPRISLPDGYEAYEQKQSRVLKKIKSESARRRRRLEQDIGPVRFSFHNGSDEVYAILKAMKAQQYDELNVRSVFDVAWTARALDLIRETQTAPFSGVVSTLHAGERLMAVHFGMRSSSVLHWWFPTYDRTASKYSAGIMLLFEVARHAHDFGVSLIDLGRGDEHFKTRFNNDPAALCEGSIERVATMPGLLRKGQKTALRITRSLPLGKYESYPRRALARLISGMDLPAPRD